LYSGAGIWQCGSNTGGVPGWPASLGYEKIDAQTFASWGADALKYDNCWHNSTDYVDYDPNLEADPSVRFRAMSDALEAVERPIEYEVCQWGVGYDLGVWAPKIANSWRISNDIQNNWRSIWRIANQVVPYAAHTGVGMWADMDMLIVGLKVLSEEEERFHYGLWAIEKSPLTIGAPMNEKLIPPHSLEILKNKEIMAINQDSLGEQAKLVRRYTEESYDVWAGNLSDNRAVVAVTNWANKSTTIKLDLLNEVGISQTSNVRDVWHAKDMGAVNGSSLSLQLAGHEAKILVLSNAKQTAIPAKTRSSKYYAASSGKLAGLAKKEDCTSKPHYCLPAKSKVTNMAVGSSVTFTNITAASSTLLVGVDYINYDVALGSAWSNGTNTRNLTLAVNGAKSKRWSFPISGGNWYETGRLDVELTGFVKGQANQVKVAAEGIEMGPDFVGLEVYN
jgi:alpha-galactosidase